MKILFILESEFPPDVRVENEMSALANSGNEIHLACSTRKNRVENEKFGNVFVHRKTMSDFIYKSSVGILKFPFYFNFWRKFIFRLCSETSYDVIHISDLPLSKIGYEAKRKFGAKLVIDLHENWPALLKTAPHTQTIAGRLLSDNRQWVKYEKEFLPEADKVITIIEEARDRVINLGIEPGKVAMVSNTINFEGLSIESKKNTSEGLTIFYGGAINRHRGLQIVMEAIGICKSKNININLWIVGDGSYRKNLELLSERLGIESSVKFFGQKPFKEMLGILGEADAAIIPHIRTDNNDASSPNKLYQYMYLNKPIISSDCISLKRIINQTNTGFIYKNDSAEDLYHLLEKLSSDPRLLEEIDGNGKKAVMEQFNWNIDKQRLLKAYRELSDNTLPK
jgi:glycosyltransferase involved in cell wall biosynthesis